jgi:hypothetical protein
MIEINRSKWHELLDGMLETAEKHMPEIHDGVKGHIGQVNGSRADHGLKPITNDQHTAVHIMQAVAATFGQLMAGGHGDALIAFMFSQGLVSPVEGEEDEGTVNDKAKPVDEAQPALPAPLPADEVDFTVPDTLPNWDELPPPPTQG